MRLQHIIEHTDHRDHLPRFLREECAPWLAATNNGELIAWRGVARNSVGADDVFVPDAAFVKTVRTDRHPMDNSPFLHRLFNEAIRRAGGVANRSNSAFVTGSRATADNYANRLHNTTAMVFVPVGPFRYTWHRHWADWFVAGRRLDLADWLDPALLDQQIRSSIGDQIPDNAELDPSSLSIVPSARDSANRVEVFAKYSTRDHSLIKPLRIAMAPPSLDQFNYSEIVPHILVTGLDTALRSRREVMIRCEAGLYMDADLYAQALEKLHEIM